MSRPKRRAMKTYRIAVIPGDGIGKEVVPEGIRVLEAAASKTGIAFAWDDFDWGCERYVASGAMMPADGIAQIRRHDAIFLGAVGFPPVPDHVSLWGLLIPIRRALSSVRQPPAGAAWCRASRLRSPNRKPGDIDFWIVRENSEGEYSSVGGRMNEGTERRDRHPGDDLHAARRRPHFALRLRLGKDAARRNT